jgi:hypothetical protein
MDASTNQEAEYPADLPPFATRSLSSACDNLSTAVPHILAWNVYQAKAEKSQAGSGQIGKASFSSVANSQNLHSFSTDTYYTSNHCPPHLNNVQTHA